MQIKAKALLENIRNMVESTYVCAYIVDHVIVRHSDECILYEYVKLV